jgi:arylformamidase
MHLSFTHAKQTYAVQGSPIDIAIPLHFNGPQPNTYGVPPAAAAPYRDGQFVGDVKQGGSCNFESYQLVPHCNGTHTECVGHIAKQAVYVHEVLKESLFPATLLSVRPVAPADTGDSYDPAFQPDDQVIDRAGLQAAWEAAQSPFTEALVLRSLPNSPEKKSRDYMQAAPPFFSHEAMRWIDELGIRHLLVDMPSVDRLFDEGKLSNHRIYWQVPAGIHEVNLTNPLTATRTITEMVFVPDEVKDGPYLLEMQLAAFLADAAPSRPRLWRIGGARNEGGNEGRNE